jgi:hypothetical protein
MNIKNKKLLKRIKEKPIAPLWLELRRLESSKMLYAQNQNLPYNVRMANAHLIQGDIIVFKKRLKGKKEALSELSGKVSGIR